MIFASEPSEPEWEIIFGRGSHFASPKSVLSVGRGPAELKVNTKAPRTEPALLLKTLFFKLLISVKRISSPIAHREFSNINSLNYFCQGVFGGFGRSKIIPASGSLKPSSIFGVWGFSRGIDKSANAKNATAAAAETFSLNVEGGSSFAIFTYLKKD